ncbi:MAG: hypothetical protein L3J23_02610 [Flavobacteriaceae bacterium]|nr:hypothetical protein [Flavobacteriaceae bacterium]
MEKHNKELRLRVESLLAVSMIKPLLQVVVNNYSFYIYKPVSDEELEKSNLPLALRDTINALLNTMIVNKQAFFAQFKNKNDLKILKDQLGYDAPERVTFLIFKTDLDRITEKDRNKFIVQRETRFKPHHLN